MAEALDWRAFRDEQAERLLRQTGLDVAAWNARIAAAGLADRATLAAWLSDQGVTGYLEQLLRWERFGYPDFMTATAAELIDGQYADRPGLRPVYDALIAAALGLSEVTVQVRKTYVSLVSPRRTFARIQATTLKRIDVGLRLEGEAPRGRLVASRVHDSMPVGVSLAAPSDLDDEALGWLRIAYERNC